MKNSLLHLSSIFSLCLFISCGSTTNTNLDFSNNGTNGKVSMVIRALQVPVTAIKYSVEASDMTKLGGTINNPPFDTTDPHQITVTIPNIPVGQDRLFKLEVQTDTRGSSFRGEALADVTESGTIVPMDLRFANFILDLVGDELSPTEAGITTGSTTLPDIVSVRWAQSKVSSTKLDIEIPFSQAVNPAQSWVKLYFNSGASAVDADIFTTDSGQVDIFTSFGSNFILDLVPNLETTTLIATLFSAVPDPQNPDLLTRLAVSTEVSAPLSVTGNGTLFKVSIDRNFFETTIGAAGFFNVLAGGFDNTAGRTFFAGDVANEENTADFDLTLLF